MKKRKKVVLTIFGGIVSLLVFGTLIFIGGFFFLLHKGYFPIPEQKGFLLLFSAGLSILIATLALHFLLRRRYKYFAKGILISILFSVVLFYDTTIDLIWYLTPEPFNSEMWKSVEDKPLEMVYSLMRNDTILIGKTKEEVIELLGTDIISQYSNDSTLTYHIDFGRISYFGLKVNGSGNIERIYYTYYD